MSQEEWKMRCPRYICSFCRRPGGVNVRVMSIKPTIFYQELCQENKINSCEDCVREYMIVVVQRSNPMLFRLRDMILERIPHFTEEYIRRTSAVKLMGLLRKFKRPNDATDNPAAKRTRLDSSCESGSSATLAPVRGTIAGGGRPAVSKNLQPLSQSDGSGQSQSQSQGTQSIPELIRRGHNTQSQPEQEYESSSSEGDPEDDSDDDLAEPPERPRTRQPRQPPQHIEHGRAPLQVPRQRDPQTDGTRLVGA